MKLFKTPFINLSEFSPPKINANFENFSINDFIVLESYNHSLGKNQISLLSAEVVEPVLDKVSFKSMELLDQISIQDVCNLARERGIDRNSADRLDFTI